MSQCKHGKCEDHDPDWVKIASEVKPVHESRLAFLNPFAVFGKILDVIVASSDGAFCCGKPMVSAYTHETRRCQQCEYTETVINPIMYPWRLCRCCGNKHQVPDELTA